MPRKDSKKKLQNKKVEFIGSAENLRYISRSFYYGVLKDYEYVGDGLVLKMGVYSASRYQGTYSIVRVYVPTDLEQQIIDFLITGDNYFLITAPYKARGAKDYQYRVDLLLNIFKELY